MNRIQLAAKWADDNLSSEDTFEVQLSGSQRLAVQQLLIAMNEFDGLEETPDNAKALQSKVFDIARANEIEPKEFFTLLYKMFLNSERGPRIGNYFLDLGAERVSAILKRYL